MRRKRTPQLLERAIRLRSEGRTPGDIAEILSAEGERVVMTTVRGWLQDAGALDVGAARALVAEMGAPPKLRPPAQAPAKAPAAAPEPAEMTPDEFATWLARQLRQAQADATACRVAHDQPGAGRAMRLAAQLAALLAKVHARTADDGDVVRVTTADMQAAAERAVMALAALADRVIEERQAWPTCTACGLPVGTYPSVEKSPLRALVERVYGRAV